MLRPLIVALLAIAAAAPTANAGMGPDWVGSDNVELITRIKTVGDGVGAKVVGDTLFVTSTKSLSIFDIKDPEAPALIGVFTLDVEFENEEVPTNGKLLGISGSASASCAPHGTVAADCLNLYDVSDPANVTFLKSVGGAGDHTSACALDCTWFYGSAGSLVDARDPKNAKLVGSWQDSFPDGLLTTGCHHIRELSPGILLGSCEPTILMSIRPEDGGSPEKPVLISQAVMPDTRAIHSSRWPRGGRDRFLLIGGETNAQPACSDTVAAFMTWDAKNVVNPAGGWFKGAQPTLVDEVRPENGTYTDGHTPYNGLGCSVHWFQEHPTFHDGGLVALAEYENGTRLLQVNSDGKMTEQGYFLPLAGSTSAPHWANNGKVFYAIDYARGVDVVRYTGDTYVPGQPPSGAPGTGGAKPGASDAPACASAAGFRSVGAAPAGPGLRFMADRRETQPFSVEVFQQSAGRTLVRERLVARFTNQTGEFVWKGVDRKRRKLANGYYFVRFTMKLPSGPRDVRRLTLARRGGKFRSAPDFYQRTDCGVFRSFKLSAAAFGGKRNGALGIAYRLARGANSVDVQAVVGTKVVKRFKGGGDKAKTYRFKLPAKLVPRGKEVTIRATVKQGTPVAIQELRSRRV